MTREDAIKILEQLKRIDDMILDSPKNTYAIKMAIKALKQEPITVETINQYCKEHNYILCEKGTEPKTGHWIEGSDIDIMGKKVYWYTCSNCNEDRGQNTNYCPNCGARMFESQESEE